MACWLGDDAVADARRIFAEAGVPDYGTPEEAVRAFGMLATYRRNQALLLEAPTASENAPGDFAAARTIIEDVLGAGRDMLGELEAKEVLAAYGIPVVPTIAAEAAADPAAKAALDLGYPVALKILSPDISHKSDVGGVRLHLRNELELREAADEMLARVRAMRPLARITGFAVQAMVTRPMAQELILGVSIDPLFGPVLLFGQGGTAVEVVADRAIGLPPLNRVLARELISRTRVARLLAGYRDHPPAKLDAICDVLIALSQMLADLPELAELDINPLLADHEGVIALDARLRVSRKQEAGAAHFAITPYPAELAESVRWNGETLVIRPIRPEDEPQHKAFIDVLQPEDLRLRFFSVRRELPRSELARLAQIDYAREMAFIAVRTLPDGVSQTVGVVRAVIDPDNVDAEFAVIVRSDLKARGLGRILMRKMMAFLSDRGTERMVGYVLRENEAMRKLARSLGFEPTDAPADADAVLLTLKLSHRQGNSPC
jgi:acetyltransferase